MKPITRLIFLMSLMLLAACGSGLFVPKTGQPVNSTPTSFSFFEAQVEFDLASQSGAAPAGQTTAADPFGVSQSTVIPTITPLPSPTRNPTRPVQQASLYKSVFIYRDTFRPGWGVYSPSDKIQVDTRATEITQSGNYAMAVMPQASNGKLYIVAKSGSRETYLRKDLVAVSFWLYSGERALDLYDLAVTAIGSNDLTYFSPDDRSVDGKTAYEETFLYWLGFDDDIPAHTWVEVTIWLNEMRFDPDYRYLTGLYLTNRQGFTRTIHIDNVKLLYAGDENSPQTNR